MVYGMKLQQVNSDLKEKCLVVSNIEIFTLKNWGWTGGSTTWKLAMLLNRPVCVCVPF